MSDHDVPSTCRIEESWSGAPQPWRRATATTSNEVRPSSAITSSYEPPSFEWGAPRSFDLGAIEQPWEWRGLGPIEQPWEWPIEPLDDCEETCQIHDGRNAGSQGIDELLKPEVAAILRSPNFAGTEHPGSKTAEISSNVRLGDWLRFVLIRSHASGQCHTPNTQASVRSGSTCGASGGRGTKHGRNTGSDEDDVGGDKRRKGKAKSTRFEENTRGDSVNELACPFPKRKPLDHTRCWMFSFVNTARLKDHLKRCHPVIFRCPTCGEEFCGDDQEEQRDRHITQQPQCDPRDLHGLWPDRIRPDAWKKIFFRKKKRFEGFSDENYWMEIYSYLFPGATAPSHPYHEDYKTLVRDLDPVILASDITRMMAINIGRFVQQQRHDGVPSENILQNLPASLMQLIEPAVDSAIPQRLRTSSTPSSTASTQFTCSSSRSNESYSSDSGYNSADLTSIDCDADQVAPVAAAPQIATSEVAHHESAGLFKEVEESNHAGVYFSPTLSDGFQLEPNGATLTAIPTQQGTQSDTASDSVYFSANDYLATNSPESFESLLNSSFPIDNMEAIYEQYVEPYHPFVDGSSIMLAADTSNTSSSWELEYEIFDCIPSSES